ncbi:MAG: polysaccharide biosynthesis C-terminal domain-containing protein, partial [Lachnospiraceae bacterium]|nr:polysaccharide biosynthesis C-terminal domain-containing protein [Lachnospiraceae bacterium]
RIGRGDVDGANKVFRTGMLLMVCVAAVLSFIGVFFANKVCTILGANETFHRLAADYLFWYSVFIIPSAVSMGLQNYCRNDNAPGLVSIVVIVTTVCNILGDWLLIYPMAWGTKGAAIATGISQTLGLLVVLTHFIRKKGNLRFGKIKPEKNLFREIIIHGLPEGISQLATPVMTFCMNMVLIDRIGDLGVNAFSAISYIASFSMAVFFGASEGLQPLFGQSYGAKNREDLKFYFRTGLKISFFGSAVVTIAVVLFGGNICRLFGTDAVTRSYMLEVLPQFAVGFIATAVNVMISSYLYSTERSFLALSISVLRSIIVNAAVILILPYIFGERVIWLSLLIYEVIVLIIATALLKHSERNGIHFKE